MIKIKNECVGCGLPCIGSACPHRNVIRCFCDKCKEEVDPGDLYEVDDVDLCEDCLKLMFKKEIE